MRHDILITTILSIFICQSSTAQERVIPTTEQFINALTACAAGARIEVNGDIRGSFASVYNGVKTEGSNFKLVTTADFLNSLRPEDKLDGLKIVTNCLNSALNGSSKPIETIPETVELPKIIETNGKALVIKAKTLIANDSEIRSFPTGSVAAAGSSGSNGGNGSNGSNGGGGRGGDGSPGGAGTDGTLGASASEIRIEATNFIGNLRILNVGQPGGAGGQGGAGGGGGGGGKGANSVNGFVDCRRGPGVGGDGGNAAAGGDGGRGAAGGSGGTVTVKFGSVAPKSSLTAVTSGGASGTGGGGGNPGSIGMGGQAGNTGGHCGNGGRGAGANGVSANGGRILGDGQKGVNGQIEVTIGSETTVTTGQYAKTF